MVGRSTASLNGVRAVAALLAVVTMGLLQVVHAAPATAAGSSTHLFAWGNNSTSQLGDGVSGGQSNAPVDVALPTGVTATAIAGGGGGGDAQPSQWAAYAIGSDGKLYAWGDNSNGALGDGVSGGMSATPVLVALPSGVTASVISAAQGTGYAVGSDGKLYAWVTTSTASSATA